MSRRRNFVVKFLEQFGKTPKLDCASAGRVELCLTTTETDGCLLQFPVTQHDLCEWQWKVVTLWRVASSPAQSESLRKTSAIIPSCTDTCGSRRKQAFSVLLRHRGNCCTARLLSPLQIEHLYGQMLDGEMHVCSPRCHEDEFPNRCAKSRRIVSLLRIGKRELHRC